MYKSLFLVALVFSQGNYAANNNNDEEYFEFTCPEDDGDFEDPYQCDRYYQCRDGRVTEKLCPDGLVFNPDSKLANKCDQIYNVDCKDRKELQPPNPIGNCPRQNGFFPHVEPEICNIFYHCVNGRELEMTCVAGLYFNLKTGTCVWPDMADRKNCGGNVRKKLQDGFQCPRDYEKMDKNGQMITHPNYAHPEDCSKFYICLNGVEPRSGSCDAGLVFNEDTKQCDDPENVPGCEDWYATSDKSDQ
ncbi:protein obstructor-E-like [Uranotaenia lowii]|uniref:protein obstructor-E-like n=1 Tax=Uranotaenia lowii TaxID=190385 RepID=UPI00247894B6|nr:protein obstructor-E-like [Uranotaenia lowii]